MGMTDRASTCAAHRADPRTSGRQTNSRQALRCFEAGGFGLANARCENQDADAPEDEANQNDERIERPRCGRAAHSIAARGLAHINGRYRRCRISAMTPDIDIWRAANLLLKQHGENAEIVAVQRADLMLERGDRDGRLVWLRIRRAIAELQTAPSGPAH
jgi:hypothetical protein